MKYQQVRIPTLKLYGLKVELTTSQNKNQEIITKHWKQFNLQLKSNNINLGKNWKKYAVTFKVENRYFYMVAVSSDIELNMFEKITLVEKDYLYFKHKGSMDLIKYTLHTIYKKIIPNNQIDLNPNRKVMHFEMYDHEFRWDHVDSVVHVYVPLRASD